MMSESCFEEKMNFGSSIASLRTFPHDAFSNWSVGSSLYECILRQSNRSLIVDVELPSFKPKGLLPSSLLCNLVSHLTDPDESSVQVESAIISASAEGRTVNVWWLLLQVILCFVHDDYISSNRIATETLHRPNRRQRLGIQDQSRNSPWRWDHISL